MMGMLPTGAAGVAAFTINYSVRCTAPPCSLHKLCRPQLHACCRIYYMYARDHGEGLCMRRYTR